MAAVSDPADSRFLCPLLREVGDESQPIGVGSRMRLWGDKAGLGNDAMAAEARRKTVKCRILRQNDGF